VAKKKELVFGPAGIPVSCAKRDVVVGIRRVAELGLGAMEMEFVRGVRMSDELAAEARAAAKETGIRLTAHGPFWINLNAKEPRKLKNSYGYIEATAKAADAAGAKSITFHAASGMGDPAEVAFRKTMSELKKVVKKIRSRGITLDIRPELAGKPAQVGSLEEILELSKKIPGVKPCIDFAHDHARHGEANTYEAFVATLERTAKALGRRALQDMHMHVSGIEYGPKGERKHLVLKESDFNYKALLRALKDMDCAGILICESPNLEEDALLLQRSYRRLKK
jgi:deoxyribonuclease-4